MTLLSAGTASSATSTQLTVTLTSLPSLGSLTASVTVDGLSNGGQTPVATVATELAFTAPSLQPQVGVS